MLIKDKNEKELFTFVRGIDTKSIPPLKKLLSKYDLRVVSMEELLNNLKTNPENILLIDARSEKEFEESALPFAKSFPVLNNFERHNVGLIYKKYSQSSALWLAMQYADPKSESLSEFLNSNNGSGKKIFVYCWRGGGRSGYLAKMIADAGYEPVVIAGGQRAYRRIVNRFFAEEFPYRLIELSGLTGSGKSDLLRKVAGEVPVIDLESAANHYSSLLGHIPFEIKNIPPVKSQSAFENNLYKQIHFRKSNAGNVFLIESESKRVGNFEIPGSLFAAMQSAESVKIISSMENRVNRIVRDYFGDLSKGIDLMREKLTEKEKFFKQQLSGKTYSELIHKLESGDVFSFTEIMIREYYDRKYKDKGKESIAVISTDDMNEAEGRLKEIITVNANG